MSAHRRMSIVVVGWAVSSVVAAAAPAAVDATWSAIGPDGGVVNALASDTVHAGTVYAGKSGCGVFKTTDSGAHWATASTGLTDLDVTALAVDPATGSVVYAGTQAQGVFKSGDGGATWAAVSTGLPGSSRFPAIGAIAVDPSHHLTAYAGLDGKAVWKTTDGGTTWSQDGAGLLDQATMTYSTITDLAIDPTNSSVVYASAGISNLSSTSGPLGVFASADGGNTWQPAGSGPAGVPASAVAIDPFSPTSVFVGSVGQGVFRLGPLPGSVPRRHLRGR